MKHTGDRSRTLTVGTTTPISVLDPRAAHDFTSHIVIPQLYESPFVRVGDRFEPQLLEGPANRGQDRGLEAFALRPRLDIRFSDGSPLTVEDLAASIQSAVALEGIGVAVVDDCVVLTSRSWGHRPEELLSLRRAAVVKEVAGEPLGTGPFMLAEKSAAEIRLLRNPYAVRQPRIEEVVIRWYPCSADGAPRELIAALDDGSVDFTMSLSRDDVRGLKSVRKLFQAGMSTAFLALNTERPHFAVVALRRTIAAALDRYRLTALCYENPLAFVARGVLPPGLGGGAEGMRYEPVTEGERGDPSELPRRLAMVRVWGPRPYLPRPDAVAAAIEEQLRPLGVVVETIAATDSEHYLELLTAGDYDLALCGWVADTP